MKLDEKETNSVAKLKQFCKNVHNRKAVHDMIDELCAKGIAKGCYQDYGLLIAFLEVLTAIEGDIQ